MTWHRWTKSRSKYQPFAYNEYRNRRTRYRNATPPPTNQNSTIKPDIPKISIHVLFRHTHYVNHQSQRHITHNQFLLAHHKVTKKHAAKTREAILLAFVSNPHAIRHAPMNEDPRYPAGNVIHCMPPDILVAPPSSAVDQPVEKKIAWIDERRRQWIRRVWWVRNQGQAMNGAYRGPGAVVRDCTLNEVVLPTVELNWMYMSTRHHTSECMAHLVTKPSCCWHNVTKK